MPAPTAWGLNILVYLLSCWVALTFAVKFSQPQFATLLLAWLAGLIFTWGVIEPSEVLGLVLFPRLANNDHIMKCREKCKETGIYG